MKHYTINDCYIGASESFTRTVTAEMMDLFREISGDIYPNFYNNRKGAGCIWQPRE